MNPDPKRKRNLLKRGWVKRLGETNETVQKNFPYPLTRSRSPFSNIRKRVMIEILKKDPYYEKIIESRTVGDLAVNLGLKLFEGIPKNIMSSRKDIAKMPLKERMKVFKEVSEKIKDDKEKTALALALRLQEAFKKET